MEEIIQRNIKIIEQRIDDLKSYSEKEVAKYCLENKDDDYTEYTETEIIDFLTDHYFFKVQGEYYTKYYLCNLLTEQEQYKA